MDEFAQRLFGELDYVQEGESCEKFAKLYAHVPRVRTPGIHWSATARRSAYWETSLPIVAQCCLSSLPFYGQTAAFWELLVCATACKSATGSGVNTFPYDALCCFSGLPSVRKAASLQDCLLCLLLPFRHALCWQS